MKTQNHKSLSLALALAALALGFAPIHQAAADGFVSVRSMNSGRSSHTATLLPNGKVLVAGGGQPQWFTSTELYDPANNTWTLTGSLHSASYFGHTATLLPNGKVLIAGGQGTAPTAELYDPATGQWTRTGSPTTQRRDHDATLLPNGKVLVTGGRGFWEEAIVTAELYDPATGTWTATGSITQARGYRTATLLLNGKVLVSGGASAELYDPATGMWTPTGPMTGGGDMATLLLNGKVLVTGGASAELYDPDSGTWSATGSPTWAHFGGAATLLRNGKVLVAGGIHSGGIPAIIVPSAELYDPAAGTWTEITMNAARYVHTATLLPNGKVLVAGGLDVGIVFNLSSAEIYEPDSDGAPPSITLLHHSNQIMSVSWTGAGILEQSDSLTEQSWRPAPVQDNPHTVSITGPRMFFRLRFNE